MLIHWVEFRYKDLGQIGHLPLFAEIISNDGKDKYGSSLVIVHRI